MNSASEEPRIDPRQPSGTPAAARRPYESPRLSDCGSLRELTNGGGHSGADYGVTWANHPDT
jgi:hypothetical protein